MAKLRLGFVSNSSSSSFVVIGNTGEYEFPEFADYLVIDNNFGTTEFGWGPDVIRDVNSRIIFAYLQCLYSGDLMDTRVAMLEGVIKRACNVSSIDWVVTNEYSRNGYGYIDHQSSAYEGANVEIFQDETTLKNFIFDSGSKIVLDNDNH